MTVIADTPAAVSGGSGTAADHLWMHFTRMGGFAADPVPVVERGEGAYIFDSDGRRYLDALSGLFVVQAGYGRDEIADAADKQMRKLAYFPIWSYATPPAVELADRLAGLAPGDLNKVFFSSGGGESVETAWKLAKQYFKLTGRPSKTKVISRAVAYHGTTQGALSITGVPNFKDAFEPLVPGTHRVPNTDFYRAPDHLVEDEKSFGLWAANRVEEAILAEGCRGTTSRVG
jgi:adenosylmethionine-8-amino-7-oxononanoate aminotransferase